MSEYEKIDLPIMRIADADSDPYSWAYSQFQAEVPLKRAMGAAWDIARDANPVESIRRMREYNDAADPNIYDFNNDVVGQKPVKFMTRDEWKHSPHYRSGLEFDNGVNEDVARLVAKRHDERRNWQDILARKPEGFVSGAATFGTSFVASALDPLNIAMAMIPIFGEAKFAATAGMAAKVGQTFARGAGEAAVGTLAVEPLNYFASQQDQADWHASDALLSAAFGGVLGGGINVAVKGLTGAFRKSAQTPLTAANEGTAPRAPEGAQTPLKTRLMQNTALSRPDFVVHEFTPQEHLDNLRTALAQLQRGEPVDMTANIEASRLSRETSKPIVERTEYGVTNKDGTPVVFSDKKDAFNWLYGEEQKGTIPNKEIARVVPVDGGFGVNIRTRAEFRVDDTGAIQTFGSQRKAKAALAEGDEGRVVQIANDGKSQQFVILDNAAKEEAAIITRSVRNTVAEDLSNPKASMADAAKPNAPQAPAIDKQAELAQRQKLIQEIIQRKLGGATTNTKSVTPTNANIKHYTAKGNTIDLAADVAARRAEYEAVKSTINPAKEDAALLDSVTQQINNQDDHFAAIDAAVNCLLRT